MAATVRLSARSARALLERAKRVPPETVEEGRAFAEMEDALEKLSRVRTRTSAALKATAAKRKTKREKTAELYWMAMARADGVCECGCGQPLDAASLAGHPELDHFRGRGRARQTVPNTWMLRRDCHRAKHRGSRAVWLAKYAAHARRHGYQAEAAWADAELEAEQMAAQLPHAVTP